MHISSLCIRELYHQREHLQFPYFMKLGEGILMFKVLGCFPADVQHCLLLMETILPMSLVNFPKKMENLSVFSFQRAVFSEEFQLQISKTSTVTLQFNPAALATEAG